MPAPLPSRAELADERVRRSLIRFVERFWPAVEPAIALRPNWHMGAVCAHLEAVSDGRIRRLIINIPPGHAKSLLVCVFWPAWEWLTRPGTRSLYGSYGYSLAERDSIRCKSLILSDEYQALIPRKKGRKAPLWQLKGLPDRLDEYHTTAGGFRQVISIGGKATGLRGHRVVIDDPINVVEADSVAALREACRVIDQSLSSRLIDPATGQHVLIMQRVNERDPSGHLLAQGGYEHLNLPSEYEGGGRCVCPIGTPCSQRDGTSIGFRDPRRMPGELLNPEMFTATVLAEAQRALGARGYAGQHQERPAPAEGAMLSIAHTRRRWARRGVTVAPPPDCTVEPLPEAPGEWRISADLKATVSQADATSYVAIGVLYRPFGSPSCYLVDLYHGRPGFTESISILRRLHERWPQVNKIRVEDKALGPAVIETLKQELPGVEAWMPHGDKVQRWAAVLPLWEGDNVVLPACASWVDEAISEFTTFPGSAYDDRVDMMAQALADWQRTATATSGHSSGPARRSSGIRGMLA